MNVTELCVNCKQNNSCTMCWKTSNKKCPHFVQKTNADKIRAMNDEELAKVMERMLGCPVTGDCKKMLEDCNDCWLEWLQQTAE